MTHVKSLFAIRLGIAIEAAGFTQEEVAAGIGLGGRQSIQPYLTDRVSPTLKRVEKLAEKLQVKPGWLAGWQDHGGPPPREDRLELYGGDWQQAVRALYRYAARQVIDVSLLRNNPKERRALCRKSDHEAERDAKHALEKHQNREGCKVRLPSQHRSYRKDDVIVLADDAGIIAKVRVSCRRHALNLLMRVIPLAEKRALYAPYAGSTP